MTRETLTYFIKNKEELRLTVQATKIGLKSGEAMLGSTSLKFVEIDDANTDRLINIANNACAE